jgi:tetratricopeptide (TPR) repeat protein
MRVLAATQGVNACIKRLIALTSIYAKRKICLGQQCLLNIPMTPEELVVVGNQHREQDRPDDALAFYAQAFVKDRNYFHAWNNYGNVLRESGDPVGAVPFLQRAISLDPNNATAQFNLSVAYLLAGNYAQGWPQYEHRWNFEHLTDTLPQFNKPRWTGQDLKDKTIMVCQEQGLGDTIQFVRFIWDLHVRGAKIILLVNQNLEPLFASSKLVEKIVNQAPDQEEFDYWIPIMSLPNVLGITLENLKPMQSYLTANESLYKACLKSLGPKHKLRVGFCWSGRRDNWVNRYKGMNLSHMLDLIEKNPNYDWINLQLDATPEETQKLINAGVVEYNIPINNFADTAALVNTLDVVITVDTAVAHLAAALGRPTWIMLGAQAVDWRWLLGRESSPWYLTARLLRQPVMGDWASVTNKIHQYLGWFKI